MTQAKIISFLQIHNPRLYIRTKEILPIYFEITRDCRMAENADPNLLPPSHFYSCVYELGLTLNAVATRVSMLMK